MSNSAAPPRRQWTVMVYFSADNNLAVDAIGNLNEMLNVGSSPEVQVLALADLPDVGGKTYVFRPTDEFGEPREPLIHRVADRLDTGDPRRLKQFLRWGISTYDAEHYCVVIWGHAAGWDEFDECRVERLRKVAGDTLTAAAEIFDDRRVSRVLAGLSVNRDDLVGAGLLRQADFLNNAELKKAFDDVMHEVRNGEHGMRARTNFKFDVVAFDACLMGMAEVAGQLYNSVRYMVASEAEIPNRSWPYGAILSDLLANPFTSPLDLASLVVNAYVKSCEADPDLEDFPATLSVLNLGRYAAFTDAIRELAAVLSASYQNEFADFAVHRCLRESRSFFANSYVDIYDFCERLRTLKARWKFLIFELEPRQSNVAHRLQEAGAHEIEAVIKACGGVLAAVEGTTDNESGFVVYERHTTAASNSHGVSIFFPSMSRCYPDLNFARQTGWQEYLRLFLSASLAASREGKY